MQDWGIGTRLLSAAFSIGPTRPIAVTSGYAVMP